MSNTAPAAATTSAALHAAYPVKGSMPQAEIERLYAMREAEVAALHAKEGPVTVADLQTMDWGARWKVAEQLFAKCAPEAKTALLQDEHHHVRSCAALAR